MPEDKQTKFCYESHLEAKAGDGTGFISGYASVFDIVDRQGDIIKKGAFARSINNRVSQGKVGLYVTHLKHGGDVKEFIGEIVEAKEDDFGLWINVRLSDSQTAQETRSKVIDSPNMFGLSVGFEVVKEGAKKIDTGFEFTEVILREVTITAVPANESTNAVAKNDVETLREVVDTLRKQVDELTREDSDVTVKKTDLESAKDTPDDYSALDEINRQKRMIAILEASNG